jgi:cysteine synthase A
MKDPISLIGSTPLVALARFGAAGGAVARVLAKVEARNPGGSVKDRVALAMIEDAERRGTLAPGGTVVEPTSGNTGIGLALVCAVRGYRLVLTMPESMSVERRVLVAAYGAEVVLTPAALGMKGAIARAEELRATTPGAVTLGQFDNPANPAAHYAATGAEIWADTRGEVDIFVAGVGTGGMVSGAGRRLKEESKGRVKVVAVQPAESPVLTGGAAGPHGIQGIGAGFVPGNYDARVVDAVVDVSYDEAAARCRELARTEGLLAGISSGAALHAAAELAKKAANRGKTIVAILPDTGERYLSTGLY